MDYELKNCPFCGSEAELIQRGNEFSKSRTVEIKCKGRLCRATMINKALRNGMEWLTGISVAAWNNRQSLEGAKLILEAMKDD